MYLISNEYLIIVLNSISGLKLRKLLHNLDIKSKAIFDNKNGKDVY